MIVILPTTKLQALLPRGLLSTEDPLLICAGQKDGTIVFMEFGQYCQASGRPSGRTDNLETASRREGELQHDKS
jgi:hypothetical protein